MKVQGQWRTRKIPDSGIIFLQQWDGQYWLTIRWKISGDSVSR